MSALLAIILLFFNINGLLAAENDVPGCQGGDSLIFTNPEKISLSHIGEILIFDQIEIEEITGTINNAAFGGKLYIDAMYDPEEKQLTVFPTENFVNYADEQTERNIFLQVTFRCPRSTKSWIFYQEFKKENLYAPIFSQQTYEISIPLPLYNGFELTVFQEISAKDKDLDGNVISFSSADSEKFLIRVGTSDKVQPPKTYFSTLALIQMFLSIPSDRIEFIITATDSGSPPQSSTAAVIITAKNDIPPAPRFEKFLYEGSLDGDYKLRTIETAILVDSTYSDDVDIVKYGEDESLFNIESITNTVVISLVRELVDEDVLDKQFLKFNLRASRSELNETGNTGVVISVPRKKPDNYFEKTLYLGEIALDGKLEIETINFISDGENVNTFSLESPDAIYFNIESSSNVVRITFKPDIDETDWKDRSFLSVKILAKSSEKLLDTTEVVVDIPKNTFYFEKSIYEGEIEKTGSLVLETIIFNKAAYTNDVQFSLKENEFFNFTSNENEITITLADNGIMKWRDNRLLSFFIEAVNDKSENTSAVIAIALPEPDTEPEFEKPLYDGEISVQSVLTIDEIVLIGDTYKEYTVFELKGTDKDLFVLNNVANRINLELSRNLTVEEIQSKAYIFLTVTARNELIEGETGVIITIASVGSSKTFKAALAQGKISADQTLEIGRIELVDDKKSEEFRYNLTGDESDYFLIKPEIGQNWVQLELEKKLPQDIFETKKFLSLIIESENILDNLTGSTAIILNLPGGSDLSKIPLFTKKLYKGHLDEFFYLTVEDIQLVDNSFLLNESQILLEGPDADFFTPSLIDDNIVLKLKRDINEKDVEGKLYLECSVVIITNIESRNSANVIIDVPQIGRETTTCPSPEPCPTPDPPTDVPKFSKELYKFRAAPNYIGKIGFVSATISSSSAEIIYAVLAENDELNACLSIQHSEGEIYITCLVPPGVYSFEVTAENADVHSKGYSSGLLEIDGLLQCGNQTQVSHSLLVKHLEEEKAHSDIMGTILGECHFEISSMDPNKEEYFKINQTTSMLTSIKVDREDDVFSEMIAPQIQVKLKLVCPEVEEPSVERKKRSLLDYSRADQLQNRSMVLTEDILATKDVTILSVILVDINDNYPEFISPARNNFVVGYPESKVSSDILPDYLYKVEATDKDDGINATIRYSIESNRFFGIEPETGVIYPLAEALSYDSVFSLKVYAKDRDGAADCLTSTTTLRVKPLLAKHLTLLTFNIQEFDDLKDLETIIKDKTGIELIVVKHAMVPSYNESDKRSRVKTRALYRAGDSNIVLKVWAYALDDRDEPIESSEIERKITEVEDYDIQAESYEQVRLPEIVTLETSKNIVGYIVAVSLLSVLSACCIGFLSWWFYFRNKNFNRVAPTSSTSATPPFVVKPTSEIEYKNYLKDIDLDYEYPSSYQKRESVHISGMTTDESDEKHLPVVTEIDKPSSSQADTGSIQSEGSNNSEEGRNHRPRTTVTFNELVERIHIETGDDENK